MKNIKKIKTLIVITITLIIAILVLLKLFVLGRYETKKYSSVEAVAIERQEGKDGTGKIVAIYKDGKSAIIENSKNCKLLDYEDGVVYFLEDNIYYKINIKYDLKKEKVFETSENISNIGILNKKIYYTTTESPILKSYDTITKNIDYPMKEKNITNFAIDKMKSVIYYTTVENGGTIELYNTKTEENKKIDEGFISSNFTSSIKILGITEKGVLCEKKRRFYTGILDSMYTTDTDIYEYDISSENIERRDNSICFVTSDGVKSFCIYKFVSRDKKRYYIYTGQDSIEIEEVPTNAYYIGNNKIRLEYFFDRNKSVYILDLSDRSITKSKSKKIYSDYILINE